ncbi:MAG: GNAT family N-acetyltransferase [Solirubrobacterales bacterium]
MELIARAELIADGGAAARSEEFFRCRPYLDAEGTSHTLRIETSGAPLVAPLLVRDIPEGAGLDAVSPYGYPGIVREDGAAPTEVLDPATVDWSSTGLVSFFLRSTATGPHALAAAERSTLQISDPAGKRKSRMSDRQQIRRNEAAGYATEILPGPEASEDWRAGFRRAYEQTMVRSEASQCYFFEREWFDSVFSSPRTWLVVVNAPEDGGIAAASIGALSDGVLHYFLSGTADEHLREAPMKNAIVTLQDLSDELGAPLNLGGGLSPGDGLEEFKRGFANRQEPFLTHEVVCDDHAYERLSAGREAKPGFFPDYRA